MGNCLRIVRPAVAPASAPAVAPVASYGAKPKLNKPLKTGKMSPIVPIDGGAAKRAESPRVGDSSTSSKRVGSPRTDGDPGSLLDLPKPALVRPANIEQLEKSSREVPFWSFEGRTVMAKCVYVYDGDTAHFNIMTDSGLGKLRCRFAGINSAEVGSRDPVEKALAIRARDSLADMIEGRLTMLQMGPMDKYGRPLVVVWTVQATGAGYLAQTCINNAMLERGLAMPYDGTGEKLF